MCGLMVPESPRPERSRPTTLWPCLSQRTPVQLHGDSVLAHVEIGLGDDSELRLDMKEMRASLSVVMFKVAVSTKGNMDLLSKRRKRRTKWEGKLISVVCCQLMKSWQERVVSIGMSIV